MYCNLIETELHSKINITEFYKQEQTAIKYIFFYTSVTVRTFSDKETFNRILKNSLTFDWLVLHCNQSLCVWKIFRMHNWLAAVLSG